MILRTLDVTDEPTFGRLPPCADPGFDHRSCDYWEDDAPRFEGRPARLARAVGPAPRPCQRVHGAVDAAPGNPFLADLG